MEQVATQHPTARLVFFEADPFRSPMLDRAKELAAELGVLGHQVLFADWVPPEQWGACLLEADVGLSYHAAHIETHLAFRTRLLDYIWAGLPIVTARGDVLSDLAADQGLGHAVEPGDVQGLAAALIALLADPQARTRRAEAFRQVAEQFRWQQVTLPLQHYCRQPWYAADRERRSSEEWRAVERDQILARAAHTECQLAETEARARHQASQLQAQIDDLTGRLGQCEERFAAAMSGRVMRWMTGFQNALRGTER
jgi:hypothetical protein